MTPKRERRCLDCGPLDRREFLKTAALAGIGATVSGMADSLMALPRSYIGKSETLVAELYESLNERQKQTVTFEFGHPLQSEVDNNWRITPPKISDFFDKDQQVLIGDIFRSLHNPEYLEEVLRHIREDGGGLGNYSVAIFGRPGSGKFQFVLAGRHCTIRCDGDSVDGAAFGGPIFYGHASRGFHEKPDHPGNVYWYQAKRANEVFEALDGRQREIALLGEPRRERGARTVALEPAGVKLSGLPVAGMSRDQKELVEKVLSDLLLPFRQEDAQEALRYISNNGGFDDLHLAFYENLDIGDDGVWDVWQLESSKMVWYFRGHPHVHVWVNIKS